ncbi:MAG: enoyl-ACP reductase FabI [Rickettsiales bacterium]
MSELLNLDGKKGLVVGVANTQSIAYGCARIFQAAGAELVLTYHNEKTRGHVEILGQELRASLVLPCDVSNELQMELLFEAIGRQWGELDFLLHSIAYAPKVDLHGRVTDCSKPGFLMAMDISCHSFMRMAKLAEPLMKHGGCMLTVSYYGAEKAVKHYNMMGPVKGALESAVRYMAVELGEQNIRVNAISPGTILTRAASGIADFSDMLASAALKSPLHRGVDLNDIGSMAAFLVSDLAKNITGGVHHIDAGYEVVG